MRLGSNSCFCVSSAHFLARKCKSTHKLMPVIPRAKFWQNYWKRHLENAAKFWRFFCRFWAFSFQGRWPKFHKKILDIFHRAPKLSSFIAATLGAGNINKIRRKSWNNAGKFSFMCFAVRWFFSAPYRMVLRKVLLSDRRRVRRKDSSKGSYKLSNN